MKYLCLVYLDEKRLNELPDEECVDFDTAIRNSGHCIASEALESVQAATTVRMRNGRLSVTDGPFAETREVLGGYYIVDFPSLDEAIRIAERHPGIRFGAVEIRPILEIPNLPTAK